MRKFNSFTGIFVGIVIIVIFTIVMSIVLYPSYIENEENKQIAAARTSLIICKRLISEMEYEKIDFDIIDNTVNTHRNDNISDEYRNQFIIDLGNLYNKNVIIKVEFIENEISMFYYEVKNKGVSIDVKGNVLIYTK